jgi:hypothetical protein
MCFHNRPERVPTRRFLPFQKTFIARAVNVFFRRFFNPSVAIRVFQIIIAKTSATPGSGMRFSVAMVEGFV